MEEVLVQPPDASVYGHLISTPAANPLSFAIGQFLVNCGVLEFESYVWIHGFGANDPQELIACKTELFAARKTRLVRIMEGLPIAAEAKVGIREVWGEAIDIMRLRNIVAHNPILVQYNGSDAKPEWTIRVIDARTMSS